MFKILGSDGKEYGPVTAEVVREWIKERRATGQTRVQPEGNAEWIALSALPEFAAALAASDAPPPLPPRLPSTLAAATADTNSPPKTSGMAIASLVLGLTGFCGITALIGMILGIVATIRIRKSNGRLKGKGLAIAGICVSAVMFIVFLAVAAGLLLPALAKAKYQEQNSDCVSNVKHVCLAIRLFADENEGKCPQAANWCDAITQNLAGKHVFQCPQRAGSDGAFAFNAKLAGKTLSAIPPDTVMIFESSKGWNFTGGADDVTQRPPHGRNFVFGFADGSVREINKEELKELRWEP